MKKYKLLVLISILIIFISISSVYAFYMLNLKKEAQSNPGLIESGSFDYYYNSSNEENTTSEEVLSNDLFEGIDSIKNTIKMYASEKRATDTTNYLQSNKLIVKIKVKTDIAIKIRIKIQDEWTSIKTYNSKTIKTNTMTRQYSTNNPPFTFSSDWTYDENSGYAYYNNVINSSSEEQTISMLISNNYTYQFETTSTSYRETILLTLGFKLDAVQANRANIIWGV